MACATQRKWQEDAVAKLARVRSVTLSHQHLKLSARQTGPGFVAFLPKSARLMLLMF